MTDQERSARRRQRFELMLPLRYWAQTPRGQTLHGRGQTCNISSSGLLIETDQPLSVGDSIKLSIDWPALPEGLHRLVLIVAGEVVRIEPRGSAVRIRTTEFRIRGQR